MAKFIKTERRMGLPVAGERRNGELVFNGYRVSVGEAEKKFWR